MQKPASNATPLGWIGVNDIMFWTGGVHQRLEEVPFWIIG
jgi:hypothetical protein